MGLLSRFQIRDLEEFSGVKAHTIRIWEKRYSLLAPDRTDTNIRTYGIDDLKTILNVAYLNQQGVKISKIAALTRTERERMVQEKALADTAGDNVIDTLKLAMLAFDEVLFESASSRFREKHGFDQLVERIYVPLLELIGVLWQTSSICPAHEHFISNIIRNKLIAACEAVPLRSVPRPRTFILFLPDNELHELGLLYVNFLLRSKGEHTIYLGQSVPLEDLGNLAGTESRHHVFISILTTSPTVANVPTLVNELKEQLPPPYNSLWFTGQQIATGERTELPVGARHFSTVKELLAALKSTKGDGSIIDP